MILTRWCLRNPIAVAIFFVFVVMLGALAYARMGRSILPPISLPVVGVEAPYAGAGPDELERVVIEPIEDALDAVPDVHRVSGTAQNGIAQIVVEFRFGSNLDVDRANVQQAVNAAMPNMPGDLLPPVVSNDDPAAAPILEESISSAVTSDAELATLVDRTILPALRSTAGVGSAFETGAQTPQFTVRPNPAALDATGATVLDVLRTLTVANDALPGGDLRTPIAESSIDIRADATSAVRLRSLPVAIPGGATVALGDLSTIENGYADQTMFTRVDGSPAIIVYVTHAQGAGELQTIAAVRRTFAELATRYPSVRFEQLRSDEPFTEAAISGVLQTLGEGVTLTLLVMLAFLHSWRSSLIAAIAIPTSLCAALVAMWLAGFTINVLSLMGLSLTIGILVDDSIVIIEAIAGAAARGLTPHDAALAGRQELGSAAFAITLVDVAVFAPIALTSDVVGEFMREFGLVVVFATSFSLLAAFTLTPLLCARWTPLHTGPARVLPWTLRTRFAQRIGVLWNGALDAFARWETRVCEHYTGVWLPYAMRHRRRVFVATAAACALSLVPVVTGWIPTEFSPPVDRGEVRADLTLPAGTPLARTDTVASRMSAGLLDDDRVKHVALVIGRAFNGETSVVANNLAEFEIVLNDSNASGNAVLERLKHLAASAPSAKIAGAGRGMGGTAPISYNIGGDPGAVTEAAQRLVTALSENPYATDVRTSDAGAAPHMRIAVDSARTRELNVSTDDAAQTARIATGGTIAMKTRLPSGLVNVVVRSDAALTGNIQAIKGTMVRSAAGSRVPLGDVVAIVNSREAAIVTRENRERVVTVSANTVNDAPIGLVATPIGRRLLDGSLLPPGAHLETRGDVEQLLATIAKIGSALALSVLIVYAILAILYRSYNLPLIVMATVPLASIGSFGALALTRQPLNLYSMLGIVMLVGLVAKNGILLVDYAERRVRDGDLPADAIRDAAKRRLRPILMTTCAMIAGMLPLALGETIGAQYRQALGTVVIGGLLSSLLLTLFVIPTAYEFRAATRGYALATQRSMRRYHGTRR